MSKTPFRRMTRQLLCGSVAVAGCSLAAPAAEVGTPDPTHREAGPKDFLIGSPLYDATGGPLMRLLDTTSAGRALRDAGFVVGGHVQGGYTYYPQRSANDVIFGRVFDDAYGNAPQLDQIGLSLTRLAARDRFDLGGRVEVLYGYDTFRFHSNGLDAYGGNCGDEDDSARNPEGAAHKPRNQFDLTQAYLDLNVDVGTGLLVRAGKFVTPLGYETIDPTTTPFYSRSYLFGFAKPFTHTGVLLNYRPAAAWDVWGGVVRGWDQSIDDNNGSVSALGRVDWRPNDRLDLRAGAIVGREGTDCGCDECDGDNGSRLLVDLVATYKVTDALGIGAEALYGRSGSADETGGSAEWYGAAGYASYAVSRAVRVNARLEYFRDTDGTRLLTGSDLEVASATVGLTVSPFATGTYLSGLAIQPEVRYDHATTPEFDGGTRKNQVTFGVGVLYAF
jgi:hypothetical protein